jgi:pilus assembly protein Flp/PilA
MALSRGSGSRPAFVKFMRDDRGATAIEYGLIAGLIALVVIGAMSAVFSGIGAQFNNIGANL